MTHLVTKHESYNASYRPGDSAIVQQLGLLTLMSSPLLFYWSGSPKHHAQCCNSQTAFIGPTHRPFGTTNLLLLARCKSSDLHWGYDIYWHTVHCTAAQLQQHYYHAHWAKALHNNNNNAPTMTHFNPISLTGRRPLALFRTICRPNNLSGIVQVSWQT